MSSFAAAHWGRERRGGGETAPRHRHRHSYAAFVLSGGYEEAGDLGRRRVAAGDVLFHACFDAHSDRFNCSGAEILNLALPEHARLPPAARVADPDAIVRAAEHDLREAVTLLLATCVHDDRKLEEWPDQLAEDLAQDPGLSLTHWARERRLAPATVSRTFRRVYGLPPCRFRAQARARLAWGRLDEAGLSLVMLAADTGFADHAHMTRAISSLTGRTPSEWRRASNPFKTRAWPSD